MGDNSNNLKKMIKIYKPNGYDWMNFALSRRNPFTFHHIISKSNGGSDTIKNGAILTRRAHNLLHILEYICPMAYDELTGIFTRINISKKSPDEETISLIDEILCSIFLNEDYDFVMNADLSEYIDAYYSSKKNSTKKLRK